MKLNVSTALLVAAVIGAASASSEVVNGHEEKTRAALRHGKLADRKNRKTPANKMRRRKMRKDREKKVAEARAEEGKPNKNAKKNGQKNNAKKKQAFQANIPEGSIVDPATSRIQGSTRAQSGGGTIPSMYEVDTKGWLGDCFQLSCPNPKSRGGIWQISVEMYEKYGCKNDSDCKSNCCIGKGLFGWEKIDNVVSDVTCCVDTSSKPGADNGCRAPVFTGSEVPGFTGVGTINNGQVAGVINGGGVRGNSVAGNIEMP